MPAFKTTAGSSTKSVVQRLEKLVERQLDIPLQSSVNPDEDQEQNFELFALVPLSKLQDRGLADLITKYKNPEIAVRLKTQIAENFTLRNMEDMLSCNAKTKHLL